MTTVVEWELDLVEEELELPGWLLIPADLGVREQKEWLATASAELEGTATLDGKPVDPAEVRTVLETALEQRAASRAAAMFQVWPTFGGVALTCHIAVVESAGLPDWTEPEAGTVVRAIDVPEIGPGVQLTSSRRLQIDEDTEIQVAEVTVVFDDGESTVMLALTESLAPLITRALPAFSTLIQNLRLRRTSDGARFRSRPPEGLPDEVSWDVEESS